MIKDFSRCRSNTKYYTGAARKVGIRIKGEDYIIKFRRNSPYGLMYNHVSEYIGSHIFELTGIETQQTWLGTYRGEEVVVMKDFTTEQDVFVPFNDVGDSSLDMNRERVQYEYEDIMEMLQANVKLTQVEETVDSFWDMFILDAFIGNFDRHGSNWGFLKRENRYRLAPVFDNGSCLFPKIVTDRQCEDILNSREEREKRIFLFPTSQIKLNGRKSSYYEVIASHQFAACDQALERVVKKLDFSEILKMIEEIECMSKTRKKFVSVILEERYEKLMIQPLRGGRVE